MRAVRIGCLHLREGERLLSGALSVALAAVTLALCAPANCQDFGRSNASPRARTVVPRIAVLSLPERQSENTRVKGIVAAERAVLAKRRRAGKRRSASNQRPQSPQRESSAASTSKAGAKAMLDERGFTREQMRAVAETLFADAMRERLADAFSAVVVPEGDITAAMAALHLTLKDADSATGALAICRRAGADALMVCRLVGVESHQATSRDVSAWFEVTVPYARIPSPRERSIHKRQTGPAAVFSPPPSVSAAGFAFCERAFLRQTFGKPTAVLIREAVQRAAAQAARSLRTGLSAPLSRKDDRLAVAPVLAPTRADKLLFLPTGRQVVEAAVQGLPGDASDRFNPNLLPLTPESIVNAAAVGDLLRHSGKAPADLWADAEHPDLARVRDVGQRLRVDYVLLARVTDIELDVGAPESPAPGLAIDPTEVRPAVSTNRESADGPVPQRPHMECEARAEAVGALVRVDDGALLWNGRATATMTTPLGLMGAGDGAAERRIALDAVHFALLHLQRELSTYRAGFEK